MHEYWLYWHSKMISILNMTINSKNQQIFCLFLTNNIYLLKSLLNNHIFDIWHQSSAHIDIDAALKTQHPGVEGFTWDLYPKHNKWMSWCIENTTHGGSEIGSTFNAITKNRDSGSIKNTTHGGSLT